MKVQGEEKFEDLPEHAKLAITAFDLAKPGSDHSASIFIATSVTACANWWTACVLGVGYWGNRVSR